MCSMDHMHTHSSSPERLFSDEVDSSSNRLYDLSQLYPALIQVFVVIISGYVCGRSGMISDVQSQGLNTFVTNFALPCMLFRAMATLNFSQVSWTLMSCVLISKSIVFFAVLFLTILMSSRPIKWGRAGIFAITATQSNDFALGYPIIEALYRTTHPELPQYLFLFAPVSLVILNPIGFCLLELEKSRSADNLRRSNSCLKTISSILTGVVCNPINFMTFIGIAANFVFKQRIPAVLDGVLSTFSVAFSASALFYLGLKMVGRMAEFTGFRLVVPALLIMAKLLYLPLITQVVTNQLYRGADVNGTDYANFGFLYGSIPAAPTVFVFATQYGQETEIVGTVLVLSTFLSGPSMFISAEMLSIRLAELSRISGLLSTTQFQVGILGLICAVWVIGVLLLSGRWRKGLHFFTMGLTLSQFLACLGMLLWQRAQSYSIVWHYVEFFAFLTGILGTRTWTAGLALSLWFSRTKYSSVIVRRKGLFGLVCFGIPACVTGIVVLFGSHSRHDINPIVHYGSLQIIFSAVILSCTFTIAVMALVLAQIARKKHLKTRKPSNFRDDVELHEFTPHTRLLAGDFDTTSTPDPNDTMRNGRSSDGSLMEVPLSSNSHDVIPDRSLRNDRECLMTIKEEEETDFSVSEDQVQFSRDSPAGTRVMQDPLQHDRHVVLILSLGTGMLIGLFVCFWRLFAKESDSNGIFVELEFLDGVLMFGQSLFVFAIFGLDGKIGFIDGFKRMFACLRRRQASI